MIGIFIRHYIFCFLGASTRFVIQPVLPKKPNLTFKQIYDYKKYPENEITDAIIGFIILGTIATLIFT